MPSSAAASRIMPGFGLRQSQLSTCRWKQALTASTGSSRVISCIASTSDRGVTPFPTSGWLVTTKASPFQPVKTGRSLGIQPEILKPPRSEALAVTELWNDDDPIPIEKHRHQPSVTAYHSSACAARTMADQAEPDHSLEGIAALSILNGCSDIPATFCSLMAKEKRALSETIRRLGPPSIRKEFHVQHRVKPSVDSPGFLCSSCRLIISAKL
jgi:hypothetical protein